MSGIFGSPKVATPEVKPPAPMPDANDPAVMAAERKRRASMVAAGGRRSTVMDATTPTIATEYSADKMG